MAGTTSDKLERLMQTKADIKSALIERGQAPGDVFSEYANMVRAIEGGGGSNGAEFSVRAIGETLDMDTAYINVIFDTTGVFNSTVTTS